MLRASRGNRSAKLVICTFAVQIYVEVDTLPFVPYRIARAGWSACVHKFKSIRLSLVIGVFQDMTRKTVCIFSKVEAKHFESS